MARRTDRNRVRKDAEVKFPHRVDVPIPGDGLGSLFTQMHDWCRDAVQIGAWAMYGHTERRKGEAPLDFLRFYFRDEAAALAFKQRWMA